MEEDKGNNPTDPLSADFSTEGDQDFVSQPATMESIVLADVGNNDVHTVVQESASVGELQADNKENAEPCEHTVETSQVVASSNLPALSPNRGIASNELDQKSEPMNLDAATHTQNDAPANIASDVMDSTGETPSEAIKPSPMNTENLPLPDNTATAPASNPPENHIIMNTPAYVETQTTKQTEENHTQNGAESEYEIEDETIIDSAQVRNPDQPLPQNPTEISPFTNTPNSSLIHDTAHVESSKIIQTDTHSLANPPSNATFAPNDDATNITNSNGVNAMGDVNSPSQQSKDRIVSLGQSQSLEQSDHQTPVHSFTPEPPSSNQSLIDSSNPRLSIPGVAQLIDPLNPGPMQPNLPPTNSTEQNLPSSYPTQYYTQQTAFEAQMPFASLPDPVLESPTGNRRKLNMTVSSTIDSDDRRIPSKRVEPLDTPPDFTGHKKARHSAVHAEPVQMRHPTHLTVSPLSKEPFHHGNAAIPVKTELKSERADFDPSGKPRLSKHKLKKKLLAAEQDNYEEEKRKREAILQMIEYEKEFNALKEKFFAEKIAQVLKDIEAVHEETHLEFIEQLNKIETVRRNKIASAEKMYEYHVENIISHYNSEKSSMEADFDNEKRQLSDRLNAALQDRQKKFEDERNAMMAENGADSRAMLRTLRRRTHEPVPAPPPSIKKKPTMPTIVHPLKEAEQIEDLTFVQKALSLPIKVIPSSLPTPVVIAEKGRLVFNNIVFEKGDEVWYEAQGIDRCRCYILSLGMNDVQLRSSDGIKHRLNASQLKAAKFNLERVDKITGNNTTAREDMSARDSSSARRTASRGKRQEEPQKGKPFKPSTSISAMSEEAPGTNSESISKSPSDIFKDGAGTEKGSFKPDDYWDRVASKYASTFEGKVTESVSQLLVAYSQIQWRWLPQILDLGCGSGYLTQPLLKIPYSRVISTDLSNEFNNTALAEGESATIRNHSFSKMETNKLTFAVTHTYDAVFCNMRLHWFERPQKVMSEIIRVAKPGAEVLISTWDHRAYNWFLEVITEVIGDAAKSTFFPYQEGGSLSTKESIRSFLQDCGFVETRIATREVTLTMTPEEFSECVFNQISPIMAYREIEVDQKAKADVCNRIIQSIPRMSLQDIPASQGVPSKQRVIIPCYIMMIRAIVPITKEMKESLRSLTLNL